MRRLRFIGDEAGSGTIFVLFIVLLSLVFAALAMDFNKAMARRTKMQTAIEAVAHAALVTRELNDVATAKSQGLAIASVNLPVNASIQSGDIVFGRWDPTAGSFASDSTSRDAVRVSAERSKNRGNQVQNILLRLVGQDSFDVFRSVIYETYIPACFREGFVSEGVTDLQSGNTFKSGFCIHANTHVEVNSNGVFEPGVIVSMPRLSDLVTPSSGMTSNAGLAEALRENGYQLRILDRLNDIRTGVSDPGSSYYRDYLASTTPVTVSAKGGQPLDATAFTQNHVNAVACKGKSLHIANDTTLREMVIISDCAITFGSNVALEDVTVITTDPGAKSIRAPSGLRLGRADNCAAGGGAQLVTFGGIDIPANLEMHGGQMLAKGDISFTANATGTHGAAIVSGGRIDGTSNAIMGVCGGNGLEDNFLAQYFRMAQYDPSLAMTFP